MVVLKVYENILGLKHGLKQKSNIHMKQPRSGFRNGRSMQDLIFALKQIIEKKNIIVNKKLRILAKSFRVLIVIF